MDITNLGISLYVKRTLVQARGCILVASSPEILLCSKKVSATILSPLIFGALNPYTSFSPLTSK